MPALKLWLSPGPFTVMKVASYNSEEGRHKTRPVIRKDTGFPAVRLSEVENGEKKLWGWDLLQFILSATVTEVDSHSRELQCQVAKPLWFLPSLTFAYKGIASGNTFFFYWIVLHMESHFKYILKSQSLNLHQH